MLTLGLPLVKHLGDFAEQRLCPLLTYERLILRYDCICISSKCSKFSKWTFTVLGWAFWSLLQVNATSVGQEIWLCRKRCNGGRSFKDMGNFWCSNIFNELQIMYQKQNMEMEKEFRDTRLVCTRGLKLKVCKWGWGS